MRSRNKDNKIKRMTTEGTRGRNEMDTMANSSCTGANWVVLEDTGMRCNIYPFKKGYEAEKDVPVATCATCNKSKDESNFILVGHKMLYSERGMNMSLLNQNQI